MTQWDLGRLTAFDFEQVCRDLLGRVWGVDLEIFTEGPDGGVDLRYCFPDKELQLIVQCKHYIRSGKSKLITALRNEKPKVDELAPGRYVVCTSVELTPLD